MLSDRSTTRLAQHHVSDMSEPLSAGHWVLEVLTHLASVVKVFTPMAGSNPIISQWCESSLVRAGHYPKLRH